MITKYFDHTLLKPDISNKDIDLLCKEAIEYNFMAVCVNPYFVKRSSDNLKDSDVKICTVIGFPLGANKIETKIFEAKSAIADGADELDYVINISAIKDGNYAYIKKEMQEFINLKDEYKSLAIKVILENCYLTSSEIESVCKISKDLEIDFVKTSTGFGESGAKIEDIQLMKKTIEEKVKIKASGGIRTNQDFIKFIEAGADRIGASTTVSIIRESVNSGNKTL